MPSLIEGAQLSRPCSAALAGSLYNEHRRMMGEIQGGMPRNRLRMPSVSRTKTSYNQQNRPAISSNNQHKPQRAMYGIGLSEG